MSGKHFTKYIGLLLLVVVMALASTQAFATQGGGNENCPTGTIQIAKFNWENGGYVAEGNTNGVSVSGDTTSGTFTSSTYPIAAVVVKGSTDAKIDTYNPAVMSGSFNNTGLSTPNNNNTPAISNIKFCKPEVIAPTTYDFYLKKSIQGDGNASQQFTFENTYNSNSKPNILITGSGSVFLENIEGGQYSFTEVVPPTWRLNNIECFPNGAAVTFSKNEATRRYTVSFALDGQADPTECIFYNEQPKGGVTVTKSVNWNGFPPPANAPKFEICLIGISTIDNLTETYKRCEMLGHGESFTATGLPVLDVAYSVDEKTLDPMFTASGLGAVTLEAGKTVNAGVTNTHAAFSKLNLTSDCPSGTFRVSNPNSYPVNFTWDVYGTSITGSGTAAPGNNFGAIVTGQTSGTVRLFVNGVQQATKATKPPADCVGNVNVTKTVNWNGFPPPAQSPEFKVCLTGVNTQTQATVYNECQMLAHGESFTFTNLQAENIAYSLSEPELDAMFTATFDTVTLVKGQTVNAGVTNTHAAFSKLNLTSDCPSGTFRVSNPNSYPVNYTWDVYGTSITGSGTAAPGNNFGAIVTGQTSGTVRLFVNGVQQAVKATKPPADCVGNVNVTKTVNWNGFPPPAQSPEFKVCLTGVKDQTTVYNECTMLADGGSYTFGNLEVENVAYSLSEPELDAMFTATFDTVTLVKGQTVKATVTNTFAPKGAVKPVLECVIDNYDGTFTARFGYLNENSVAITIPVGANNKFTPAPEDRGQTTVFQPGRVGQPGDVGAFSVTFNGSNLVWTLKGPDGAGRTATASSNSKRCPDQPPATGSLTIQKAAEGGEDVTFYFNVTGPSLNQNFNIQGGGLYSFLDIPVGEYTVTENIGLTPNWQFSSVSCNVEEYEVTANGLKVTVNAGDNVACTVTNVEVPPVCVPDWQKDLKHELSYIIGVNGTVATATITNKSALCEYPVGFASYEKFDDIIDNQSLFDASTTVIKPGETITLTVKVPECAAQLDLFYGDLITSFANGVRYGVRLLDALHIGGSNYCDRCTDPNPERDLKHSQSRLIGADTGRIVNLSETCSYEVGIASYQKFDDVIDHQHLFDYHDTVIEPGETLLLNVKLPECAVQVDLYYGKHLESLYKQRYGTRLLDALHLGGSNYCTPPDTELVCTPDQLGAMTLNVSTASDKLFVQASFASGTPTHVVFQLGSITWTELYNPYIFMGDGGWDASSYTGDATTVSVKAYNGALICQSGSIDIAQYLPEDETEVSEEPGTPNEAPVVILPSQNITISGMTRSGAAMVTLDASKSYDPEGTALTFQWHNGATTAMQQVPMSVGSYQVWVTVTDATGKSSTGVATIIVSNPNDNTAPVAVIDGQAEFTVGIDGTATIVLSGVNSFDSDGNIAGYLWSTGEITDSITLTLGEGMYTYTLTVIDDDGASSMSVFSFKVLGNNDLSTEGSGPTDPTENGKVTPGGGEEGPIEPPKMEQQS